MNLAADQGLIEPIHMVFFEDNIVGAEVHRDGPRVTQFPAYVTDCLGDSFPKFKVEAILHPNASEQFNQFGEIRLLDVKLSREHLPIARAVDPQLGAYFDGLFSVGQLEHASIALRVDEGDRTGFLQRLGSSVVELSQRIGPGEKGARLRISGIRDDTGLVGNLDLLEEHIVSDQKVARLSERGRAVVPEEMYDAIEAAYREHRSLLPELLGD